MTDPANVAVASGVIIRDRRIFLLQRVGTKSLPFGWELPGGKVEPGETVRGALAREMREELDIGFASATELFTPVVSVVDGVTYEISVFQLHDFDDPRPQEGQGFGWFEAHQFYWLDLIPGVRKIERVLGELIGR